MAAKADIIAMTCSQTPETKGMIDSKLLAACKPGVYIVNVARGQPLRPCLGLLLLPVNQRTALSGKGCSAAVNLLMRPRYTYLCAAACHHSCLSPGPDRELQAHAPCYLQEAF